VPTPVAVPQILTTSVVSGPSLTTTSTTAAFRFRSSAPDARFTCRLDGGKAARCSSPKKYTGLHTGGHVLKVTASSLSAGLTDPMGATYRWTVATCSPASSTCTAAARLRAKETLARARRGTSG
jgi:hypothetical protein